MSVIRLWHGQQWPMACSAVRHRRFGVKQMEKKMANKLGMFRVRQVAAMFVLEENRNGTWIILENIYSWNETDQVAAEYRADGHSVDWR
jgi:hypothetical protein